MKKRSDTNCHPRCEHVRHVDVPYKRFVALIALAATLGTPAWAATQTVTLSVPGMTCATCPFTVKKALTRVEGVTKAEVSYQKLEAVVTFDDTRTNVQALTRATENAGYPSSVKE